jgi:hypothetical protein
MVFGCAVAKKAPARPDAGVNDAIYVFVRDELNKDNQRIDYDTLLNIHRKVVRAPGPIPHIDELLDELIRQRNADPRVDRMVLIFAADIIGRSRFPIAGAQGLFEKMLEDPDRIDDWVLAFVAHAVASYPVDLPEGDRLVDTIEAHQARIKAQPEDAREHFGTHFLPPPKSKRIRSYIDGIQDRKTRESERRAYYALIYKKISEDAVVSALNYLQTKDLPDRNEASPRPLRYLVRNWRVIQDELNGR